MADNGQLTHVMQAVEELKQQATTAQHRAELEQAKSRSNQANKNKMLKILDGMQNGGGYWNDLKEELKYQIVGMQKSQPECRKVNQNEKSTRVQKKGTEHRKRALSASEEGKDGEQEDAADKLM
ncbi:hypothetical protein LR48_Vigan09g002700 [Vigna angularis]|uniref:Uncharacterized protein n=1 Tax=Phaseolus angularis TaxID=3914 RepID=A0A0L9V8N4_PHAAN|nr:hypothetical protein LR48_Vigan09g002700 [Vigna angularis]